MAMWGIQLQVPDSQVVRALEVLDDFHPEPGGEESDSEVVRCCPECESLEIRQVAGANPRQITLWSAAIPFPEPASAQGQRWRCLTCGFQWEEVEE
jgi:hypothetical protein